MSPLLLITCRPSILLDLRYLVGFSKLKIWIKETSLEIHIITMQTNLCQWASSRQLGPMGSPTMSQAQCGPIFGPAFVDLGLIMHFNYTKNIAKICTQPSQSKCFCPVWLQEGQSTSISGQNHTSRELKHETCKFKLDFMVDEYSCAQE